MGRVPYESLPVEALGGTAVETLLDNPDWTPIAGTDKSWLHACAATGPLSLRIQLAPEGAPARPCRVSLFFCELRDPPGSSFDVRLQGETALPAIDVHGLAGGLRRALVRQVTVQVADRLTLELAPRGGSTPILSGLQIERLPGG